MCFLAVLTGCLRPLLAVRAPASSSPIIGGDRARWPIHPDDPHGQRATQHDLQGERAALAYSRGTHQRRRSVARFYELKLDRSNHPMFVLSWMLFHPSTKTALAWNDASDSRRRCLTGAQRRRCRRQFAQQLYAGAFIRIMNPLAASLRDITSVSPQGRFLLDYTKFHDTVPEEP